MGHKSSNTATSKRDRILDAAERAILAKGVSATTIEELIAEVEMSKNGFFYHFRDKNQMIEAILQRNLEADADWFADLLAQADATGTDPLARFLAFLDLLAEQMRSLPGGHPGCMTTACCYQDRLLSRNVADLAARILVQWRETSLARLREIEANHPETVDVDLQDLADMLPALIDGSIIFARVVGDGTMLSRQIQLYRATVASLFSGGDQTPR